MTNSPQIPEYVTETIEAYGRTCVVVGIARAENKYHVSESEEVSTARKALLTAIAAHLRPVVPESVEKLVDDLIDAAMTAEGDPHRSSAMAEVGERKQRLLAAYQPTTQPSKSSALPDVGDTDVVEMAERMQEAMEPYMPQPFPVPLEMVEAAIKAIRGERVMGAGNDLIDRMEVVQQQNTALQQRVGHLLSLCAEMHTLIVEAEGVPLNVQEYDDYVTRFHALRDKLAPYADAARGVCGHVNFSDLYALRLTE